MQIIHLDINKINTFKEEIALCLGYFDGLHLGHISLINTALNSKYKSALLTFSSPYKRDKILTTLDDKIKILEKMKLDYLFVLSFDDKLKCMSPKEFIESIILKLNAKTVIIGPDYQFGKNRLGDYNTLLEYEAYFKTIVVPFVYIDEQKVSTSLINKYLDEGNILAINKCLKRNYMIKAKVVAGKGNGHLFNYPTANLMLLDNYKLPKNGVYKGYTYFNNKKYLSMINVGIHPSIDPLKKAIVEVHIIDENIRLYNEEIEVEFVSFLRDEKKFESINDLVTQLNNDKETIKASEND